MIFDALAHLDEADFVSRPGVADGGDRHLELELLVARVGHVAAEVDIDAGGAQGRAGYAERNGIGCREIADALQAIHEDWIAGEQVRIFVDFLRESRG